MEEIKGTVEYPPEYYEPVELEELAMRLCWGVQKDDARDDYRRVSRELVASGKVLLPSAGWPQFEAS